jgi:hypothetical protein
MWESQRDFQRVWEGWEAGIMAFHAFHTLSFPWPAFRPVMLDERLPLPDRDLAPTKGSRIHPCKRSTALVGAMSQARAVSDESLSREILKTAAELLKKPPQSP